MKNIKIILLILINVLISLSSITCSAQETAEYRLFHKDFERVLINISVKDKSELFFSGSDENKESKYTGIMQETSLENVYFLKSDSTVTKSGYALIEFMNDDKLLALYLDTLFESKQSIEDFIADKKMPSLDAFFLVRDVSLEQIQKFPPSKDISRNDSATLNILNKKFTQRYLSTFEDDLDTKAIKSYFKQVLWLNSTLLSLGYKPPQTEDDYNIIKNILE